MELRKILYQEGAKKTVKTVTEFLKSELKNENLKVDEVLWIVSTDVEIEVAKKYNVATIGYLDAEIKGQALWGTEYLVENLADIDDEYADKVFKRHHRIPWIIAETDRCIIRGVEKSDLDNLFELYAKPGITDFVEPLFSYDEEAEYEKAYIDNMYRYFGYGMWLVFDKVTGKLIGRAGLEHREFEEERGIELELGYLFAPEYQHKGYATEVCEQIIAYAKENTQFEELNCYINSQNIASIKLAERLGFIFLGESKEIGKQMKRYKYILRT